MTMTRLQFVDLVRRLVGDPPSDRSRYGEEHIRDALDAAVDAVGEFRGRMEIADLEPSSEDQTLFDLPEGFLRMRRATMNYESTSFWIGQLVTHKGEYASDVVDAYLVYDDLLFFPPGLTSEQSLTLHYEAAWVWPEREDEDSEFPSWFRRAVPFYACYYLLCNPVARFSVETQWRTREDARVDNPAIAGADWFLRQFRMVCQEHVLNEVVEV